MALRPSIQANIVQIIEGHDLFAVTDFEFSNRPGEGARGGTTIRIQYRFGASSFTATLPEKQTKTDTGGMAHVISLAFQPGRLNIKETETVHSEQSLVQEIREWLERLEADIKAEPLARKQGKQEAELDELLAKLGLADDEPFTDDETGTLVERLRTLEKRLEEAITKSEDDARALTRKIDLLHRQVEALVTVVQTQTSKKGAVRAVIGRLLAWAGKPENQHMLKDVGKVAIGLLEGGHPHK